MSDVKLAMNPAVRRVTKADAGRQLGIDIRAVGRLIASGDLKTARMPQGIRAVVLQSSVDELLVKMSRPGQQAG